MVLVPSSDLSPRYRPWEGDKPFMKIKIALKPKTTTHSSTLYAATITVLMIICAFALSACQTTPKVQNQLTSPLASVRTSPLAPQKNTQLSEKPIPTSQPGLATVTGKALHATGQPYSEAELFLATLLPSENKTDIVLYGLDVNSAPKAHRQASGDFVFINVPAGTYVLVAWNPTSSSVVTCQTGEVVKVIVGPNETHNLGELIIAP